jgi:oxygen-independent coproporphyrinogen-3 oxidase
VRNQAHFVGAGRMGDVTFDMEHTGSAPVESLYVHVPFCARKCAYCAFYSEASDGQRINRYVDALIRELEIVAPNLKPRTVFFGGGTPSLLNLRQWERILHAIDRLGLLGALEWTVECNPATVSLSKAKLLRDYGVNRISLGVQSLDGPLLERLGRIHSREMVFKSFDLLGQAGFDNVNLDLMFAIPGQTMEAWRGTLVEALAMGSEHLSCYEVIYEEDTALYTQLQAGEFEVNDELACDMYEELLDRACAAGFFQYEVANFARDNSVNDLARHSGSLRRSQTEAEGAVAQRLGSPERLVAPKSDGGRSGGGSPLNLPSYACRHNLNYWRGGSFYGLGPSATGYVGGVRTRNWSNTDVYCDQLKKGSRAIESHEMLSPLARAGETAAFGLRMVSGWPFKEFRRTTGHDLRLEWASEMTQLQQRGWGRLLPDGFQLTHTGLRFADAAAELFLR